MPQGQKGRAGRAASSFPGYAARALWIRTKQGAIVPFRLNAVQKSLHARLEEQRERTGRIRALILKARQPGVSTYVEGRFYWQVTRRRGVRAFILTHLRDATDAIFEMATRFHDRNPRADRPHTGAANAKELFFDELDSGFRVGTAGSKAVGRGLTLQPDHERIRAEIESVRNWVVGVERRVTKLAVELRERRKQTDDRDAQTQKAIDRLTADVTAATRDLASIKQQISRFIGGGRVLLYIVSGLGGLIVALLTVITTHLLRG